MSMWVNQTKNGLAHRVYHTNEECRYLNRKREITEKTVEVKGLSHCKECSGEKVEKQEQDHSIYRLACEIGNQRDNKA